MNIIRGAIGRPVTVSMFVVAVILFGYVSFTRLAVNLLPDISYPSLTVQTDYSDAAPEEIESLITRPVEESVGVVSGLTRISSTSRPGQSEVVLEFAWDVDMDLAALEVREKLDFVNFPNDAERPVILRFDPTYDPIMRLRLEGEDSLSVLRNLAEREVKKALESTDGVAAIKVTGGIEEQIQVSIDEQRLAELGIPITEVSQALTRENLNQAAGSLYDQDNNYVVRMLNEFREVGEIEKIVVRNEEGRRILLGDVARVWRGARERTILARLDGNDSVELAVYKEGDANTVTVSQSVKNRMDWLKGTDFFPDHVEYRVVFNQADFIQESVNNVRDAAILGGLLATLILFLFLRDFRSTVTIGFSIPVSIMATFAAMYQSGISLNIMSLGGVALGVGMLVDSSIVVLESVHRHRQGNAVISEAVYQGTREVASAVTASTLTTLAVFLPLVFVEGIAGQLFRDQALTITYSLTASLLVALTLVPMIVAAAARPDRTGNDPPESGAGESGDAPPEEGWFRRAIAFLGLVPTIVVYDLRFAVRMLGRFCLLLMRPLLWIFETAFERVRRGYPPTLEWALDHKPLVVSGMVLIALGATLASRQLGAELIPPLSQGEFSFELKMPEGTPLETTDNVMKEIEARVGSLEGVETVFSSVGGSTQNQFSLNAQEENYGQFHVVMEDRTDDRTEASVIRRIRQDLSAVPDLSYTFSRPTLFSFKTPVEVEIFTFDLTTLRSVADLVAARMEAIQGLSDIRTSTQLGNPEVRVRFQRERLARLGLDESTISNVLRNKIRGEVATRFREEDRQIDILVRAQESHRSSIEDIRNLIVNGAEAQDSQQRPEDGEAVVSERAGTTPAVPIRLSSVADIDLARGPAEIRRIRSQRAAVVSANLSGRALSRVSNEINRALLELRSQVPADVTMLLGGQHEELTRSYQSLVFALILAVFLVYLVMASQFESLIHPLVILVTVPLGLVGVVFSMSLTGTTISVLVLLGIIILAGIVVNNGIVLIDYTNQLRRAGYDKRSAIVQAGQVRLRPIVMTMLTTVLGLVPMALGWGQGAELRQPMAISVIGGLTFSTLLTLILIPVVYDLMDRKQLEADAAATSRERRADDFTGDLAPAGGDIGDI